MVTKKLSSPCLKLPVNACAFCQGKTKTNKSRAGSFLSTDLVLMDGNTSASFNRYSYVFNNPHKYIEPDERCPVAKDGVECTAVLTPNVKITDQKLVKGLNKIAAQIDKQIVVYSGHRDGKKYSRRWREIQCA